MVSSKRNSPKRPLVPVKVPRASTEDIIVSGEYVDNGMKLPSGSVITNAAAARFHWHVSAVHVAREDDVEKWHLRLLFQVRSPFANTSPPAYLNVRLVNQGDEEELDGSVKISFLDGEPFSSNQDLSVVFADSYYEVWEVIKDLRERNLFNYQFHRSAAESTDWLHSLFKYIESEYGKKRALGETAVATELHTWITNAYQHQNRDLQASGWSKGVQGRLIGDQSNST